MKRDHKYLLFFVLLIATAFKSQPGAIHAQGPINASRITMAGVTVTAINVTMPMVLSDSGLAVTKTMVNWTTGKIADEHTAMISAITGMPAYAITGANMSSWNGKADASNVYSKSEVNTMIAANPGPQGVPGTVGATGSTGAKGDTGTQGPQGVQGVTGSTGATGLQGAQGIQGNTGLAGAKGDNGDTGATGVVGPQGVAGATGAQGVIGLTGAQGVQGIMGTTGAKGDQGIQGLVGPAGATGPQGTTGAQGATGTTGASGAAGITGAAGPNVLSTSTATAGAGYAKGNGSNVTFSSMVPVSDVSGLKLSKPYTGVTDASGNYTVTYGITYSTAPNVQANIVGAASKYQFYQVVSRTTTGFTINVFSFNTVASLPIIGALTGALFGATATNVVGATVDVTVTEY